MNLISSAESTNPDKSILQVFRKLKFNVFKGSEKSRFFHSTFIPGLLLYYIAIFKGDIFPPPWQLANTELIGERNSKSLILDLSGLCSQHSIYLMTRLNTKYFVIYLMI